MTFDPVLVFLLNSKFYTLVVYIQWRRHNNSLGMWVGLLDFIFFYPDLLFFSFTFCYVVMKYFSEEDVSKSRSPTPNTTIYRLSM